jgi:uncharacterized protein (TIGR02246 family)
MKGSLRNIALPLLGALLGAAIVLFASAPRTDAARLQQLEDRAQITELLAAYGSTLDRHDFPAFGQLFAADAEYASGPGEPLKGRAAIQAMLERVITANPSGLPGPNRHLYFNPAIVLDGDRATVRSLGAYTVPDAATQSTRLVFFVGYQDTLVRQDGKWLFQKRVVGSAAP